MGFTSSQFLIESDLSFEGRKEGEHDVNLERSLFSGNRKIEIEWIRNFC